MFDIAYFTERLHQNADFAGSSRFFDGAIQLDFGPNRLWLKIFMGRAILVTLTPPPFGYTFTIKGSLENWRFALRGAKNRFREAVVTQRLGVEGNMIEFARIGRAVHGLTEVLREMALAGRLGFEEETWKSPADTLM